MSFYWVNESEDGINTLCITDSQVLTGKEGGGGVGGETELVCTQSEERSSRDLKSNGGFRLVLDFTLCKW